jgi:hypothetical protein
LGKDSTRDDPNCDEVYDKEEVELMEGYCIKTSVVGHKLGVSEDTVFK